MIRAGKQSSGSLGAGSRFLKNDINKKAPRLLPPAEGGRDAEPCPECEGGSSGSEQLQGPAGRSRGRRKRRGRSGAGPGAVAQPGSVRVRSAGAGVGLGVPGGTARGREPNPCSSPPSQGNIPGEGRSEQEDVHRVNSSLAAIPEGLAGLELLLRGGSGGAGADRSWGETRGGLKVKAACALGGFGRLGAAVWREQAGM